MDKVLALKAALIAAGHTMTSTWHATEALNPYPLDHPDGPALDRKAAEKDCSQVLDSDAVVILSEECEKTPGGLWFELGLGYGTGCVCVVMGPPINVFCRLGDVHLVTTAEEVIAILDEH